MINSIVYLNCDLDVDPHERLMCLLIKYKVTLNWLISSLYLNIHEGNVYDHKVKYGCDVYKCMMIMPRM